MSHSSAATRMGPGDVGALTPGMGETPRPDPILRGILITLATAGLIFLATAAWDAKADKADVAEIKAQVARVLDLMCATPANASARACQE